MYKNALNKDGIVVPAYLLKQPKVCSIKPISRQARKLTHLHGILTGKEEPTISIRRGPGIGDLLMTTPIALGPTKVHMEQFKKQKSKNLDTLNFPRVDPP